MSNHWQLHAMTSVYAPLIMKVKSDDENSPMSERVKGIRKKFQNHLSIEDDHSGAAVNKISTKDWVITNLSFPTNYLPRGTVFKHISFIPTNIPDFRKVELSAVNDYIEESSNSTLKSTAVKSRIHDTINKHEIKSMLTSITGTPIINNTQNANVQYKNTQSKSRISSSIVNFLMSNSSEGTKEFSINDLKLEIDKKIKNSKLAEDTKKTLYDSIDQAFKEIDASAIVPNKRKAEDTFNYIIEKLL